MNNAPRSIAARVLIRIAVSLTVIAMSACAIAPTEHPTERPGPGLERGGWMDRYFKYDGAYPYFVGFDLQQLHADTNIDYESKLDFLADYGVNKVRIWLNPSWFGLPGDYNYPTRGKILFPWRVDEASNRFDIDAWDPAFWERTKDFLAYARRKGIIVEISLFTVQEPRDYFKAPGVSYPFHHRNNLQDFGRPTDPNGRFMLGFYDLEYTDNGLKLADYHKAYIDKALHEFRDFNHVYYELINESPGPPGWVRKELPHGWMKHWIAYIAGKTGRIVTTQTSGFMNLRSDNERAWASADFEHAGQRYWDDANLDGFNFHLYSTNPDHISDALTGYQLRGKMLLCNEGALFYKIDKSPGYPDYGVQFRQEALLGEIRHAWGMMTAGGYYSMYFGPVPQLGDRASREGARVMQAMRSIVEMTEFQNMRPVRPTGVEYDDLVTRGPGQYWQVIADEGTSYIVYFWGDDANAAANISLPESNYRFYWMDTRAKKTPLASGTIAVSDAGGVSISPPPPASWNREAGMVLVVRKQE